MSLVDGFDDTSILSIDHLSIVAGAYDSLQIAAVIDVAIPKTRQHHLSHSQVVKAMVLNGLGFIEHRLYLFPEFFDDIAVERLLGEGITREHLNDNVLGMASNQYGVPLFLQPFSGNESDHRMFLKIIEDLKENLKSPDKVYHVVDSAFYTAHNLQSLGQHTFWISRVPANDHRGPESDPRRVFVLSLLRRTIRIL